ncbi:MAG: hypothetical protein J6K58_11435 [Lachnospiraceae bacterium]|nr:hypothetical protein [Lachnospiraceae bacterium]
MNHIKIAEIPTGYGYNQYVWTIDETSLFQYLSTWSADFSDDKTIKVMKPFEDLCPAWVKDLEWQGDVRFVWKVIELDSAVLPLLLCPDDTDFSCIVIVAEVKKTESFVYWNRIGYVLHKNEDFDEEKKNGILNTDAYSDEDWQKYGDNIAWEEVNSPEWRQWISEHWDEELYRRRMNYTLPYYQTEGNIFWMHTVNWVFDRYEYEQMADEYWKLQTIEQLNEYNPGQKMNIKECAELFANLTRDGRAALEKHLMDYQEILLHLLASELVSMPLISLLKENPGSDDDIRIYCKVIEIMWKYGDEAVVNVVDVTILESLSDEEAVWQRFGMYISEEFKTYINEEVLTLNLMMGGVKRIK